MNAPEMQRTQMLIAQEMHPQAIRYDEIYYPRTDKRAISKYDKPARQEVKLIKLSETVVDYL